jgi:hypothetical protein
MSARGSKWNENYEIYLQMQIYLDKKQQSSNSSCCCNIWILKMSIAIASTQ